ncbi:hypothetical protein AYI69_g3433 [Smittium culicis]|nr:hypothetical protein AYI69_g3433 [Smittium culicis]
MVVIAMLFIISFVYGQCCGGGCCGDCCGGCCCGGCCGGGGCNRRDRGTEAANFQFFKQSYYKQPIKSVVPRPNVCIEVGKFGSAKFIGPAGGTVQMFAEAGCAGESKERIIPESGAPGDNLSEYGKLFSSVKYIP